MSMAILNGVVNEGLSAEVTAEQRQDEGRQECALCSGGHQGQQVQYSETGAKWERV